MATEDVTAESAVKACKNCGHHPGEALADIRTTMRDSFAAVIVLDASGVIEYVNPSLEEVSGYGASEMVRGHIRMLSADEGLNERVWAALGAGKSWRGEIKIRCRNGDSCYLLASIQLLRSGEGEVTHYVIIGVDITEHKRVLKELAEREAYWRALVENAPDHILTVDRDGVIASINHAGPKMPVD